MSTQECSHFLARGSSSFLSEEISVLPGKLSTLLPFQTNLGHRSCLKRSLWNWLPWENQVACFSPEITVIFQLCIYFHLLDVPLLAEPFQRITRKSYHLPKGRPGFIWLSSLIQSVSQHVNKWKRKQKAVSRGNEFVFESFICFKFPGKGVWSLAVSIRAKNSDIFLLCISFKQFLLTSKGENDDIYIKLFVLRRVSEACLPF